jgi:capsular polysaccharide biosynthesis protein
LVFTDKQGIIGTPQRRDIEVLLEMASSLSLPRSDPAKLYVSRRRSKRSPEWERDLIKILDSAGVKIVRLEDISWVEQVSLFKNAQVIIGIHGAGLANSVFSPRGAKLIELMDTSYPNVCFEVLAQQKQLKFERLLFEKSLREAESIAGKILSLARD